MKNYANLLLIKSCAFHAIFCYLDERYKKQETFNFSFKHSHVEGTSSVAGAVLEDVSSEGSADEGPSKSNQRRVVHLPLILTFPFKDFFPIEEIKPILSAVLSHYGYGRINRTTQKD